LTAREPVLPFRYRMMARNAYDAINSEMTESELAALFRMVRVAVWDELEMLRVLGKSTLADFEKSLGPSEPAHPAPAGVSSALSSSLHLL
jgi:hypothetical protein